ncbi:Golgi phosphoprotein 3 GPP34 [Georgenia soli]|uniref:Golgi phosphoprotein 3 GPP34 n=1 Tax=Georgenia soli TaxID=638953 RepID=A0A2A9ELA7_9MICO|nr:GPP34 family phosphoprotein [Georgenia soli]PFG38999.1 Golgi phosphoprotein 3 GPP34 [Georgenia soli]
MLVAEDVLLAVTDDSTGKLLVSGAEADIALGGALLVELALRERVDVAGPDERVHEGRLTVRDPGPTGDDVLDDALAVVVAREGKKPESVVTKLGKHVRDRLYERLVAAGLLRAEEGRILGLIPTERWPTEDVRHESEVRAGLAQALQNGTTADERTAALISLLLALNAVHKVIDPATLGLQKRELKARARQIAEGDWAGRSVRRAIDSMNAAIIAATSSASHGGGGGV